MAQAWGRSLLLIGAVVLAGGSIPAAGQSQDASVASDTITFEYELIAVANPPVPMELARSLLAPGLAPCVYPCLGIEGALEGSGVESAIASVKTIRYSAASADGTTLDAGVIGLVAIWVEPVDVAAPANTPFQMQPVTMAAPAGVADILSGWGFPVTSTRATLETTGETAAWLAQAGLERADDAVSWTTAATFPPLGSVSGREYIYYAGNADVLHGAVVWTENTGHHSANHVVALEGGIAPFGDMTGPADATMVWYGDLLGITGAPNTWRFETI